MTITPRQALKILHTADVHLDLDGYVADPYTQRYREIIQQAFSTVIDLAIQESVDLLVIAGDLFDSNRPSGDVVDFAIQELRRAGRPVVMIPGNHDCLNAQSIYRQVKLPEACTNLLLISHPDGERHQLPEHNLVLWGRGMVEHEPSYRPLGGIPRRQGMPGISRSATVFSWKMTSHRIAPHRSTRGKYVSRDGITSHSATVTPFRTCRKAR